MSQRFKLRRPALLREQRRKLVGSTYTDLSLYEDPRKFMYSLTWGEFTWHFSPQPSAELPSDPRVC